MENVKKNNGFTLIELLAVIVILGVLINVAIPAVTSSITNSKKESFISSSRFFIDSVRRDAISDKYPLPVFSNDVTIVTIDHLNMEKNGESSSFGGNYLYNKCYIAIVNVGTGTDPEYAYYFAAQDDKNYAIPLTVEEDLNKNIIVANAKNKMEITVQPLCGTSTGYKKEYPEIIGLNSIQKKDELGNKINWKATIFSGDGCSNEG